VPAQADVFLQVPQPGRALDAVMNFRWLRQWGQLEAVAELLDSTNSRRAQQFMAYFEKQLGVPWRQAVDRLAGGGVVAAIKFGSDPAPTLLVVQGTDAELMQRFVAMSRQLLEQELARLEKPDRPRDETYRGINTMSVGKELHAAVVGATLLLSNNAQALRLALDLHIDGPARSVLSSPRVAEARNLLPADPLVWIWLNLGPAHESTAGKELFKLPATQPPFTVILGGWLDVVGRSPFVCAGLYPEKTGFALSVRMPRGREGMPAVVSAHVPPAGQPGVLPLLQPPGVLYSTSIYLDPAKFWEQRKEWLSAQNLKGFEEFDRTSGRFLAGHRLSQLLAEVGARQRFVVANQHDTGYSIPLPFKIPSFGGVFELRQPEAFSQAMNGVLRGAALLVGFQTKLKLVEEKRGGVTIVGYKFLEDGSYNNVEDYVRFSYSPCFATVGNMFMASSTLELGRELVDLLVEEQAGQLQWKQKLADSEKLLAQAESQLELAIAKLSTAADVAERSQLIARVQRLENERTDLAKQLEAVRKQAGISTTPTAARSQAYASGGAEALMVAEEQILAQTILNQALPPDAAQRQVKLFIDLVRQMGVVRTETDYRANDFRFDVRWRLSGK
jgi:hypothetical protein